MADAAEIDDLELIVNRADSGHCRAQAQYTPQIAIVRDMPGQSNDATMNVDVNVFGVQIRIGQQGRFDPLDDSAVIGPLLCRSTIRRRASE